MHEAGRADFRFLRESLGLTDGSARLRGAGRLASNLGRHLDALEQAGLVELTKGFEGRRSGTWTQLTPAGKKALGAELSSMRRLLRRLDGRSADRTGAPEGPYAVYPPNMSLEGSPDTKVMRAQAHPLRLQMLSLMTGAPFSAAELARELNITHSLASYHLRRLADARLVSLVETRTTHHATELRYRYLPGGPADHDVRGDLLLMVDGMAAEARRRAADAVPGAPRTLIDAELWLDPDTWESARRTLRDIGLQVHEAARPPHESGTVRIHLSLLALTLIDDRG